jgi:uncharacterized protein YegP (UPF0339 family)
MAKTKMPKIEMFIDSEGKFRFRIIARNGKTLCQSEGYSRKTDCTKAIHALTDAMLQYELENINIVMV